MTEFLAALAGQLFFAAVVVRMAWRISRLPHAFARVRAARVLHDRVNGPDHRGLT